MNPEGQSLIVVIDDTEDDIFFFSRLVRSAGLPHKILPFGSGEEAIKYFGRVATGTAERPAVCFVDVKMTGCCGFDVVAAIRSSEELDRIPVIMLSSSDDRRDIARSVEVGAQAYLVKHPSAAVFRQVMAEVERMSQRGVAAQPAAFDLTANVLSG